MSAIGGLILFYPLFNSIVFNEASYLLCLSSAFTITTQDFRIALLFWPDSTAASPTTYRQMVAKWDGDLTTDTGWWLGYKPSDGSAFFAANDGGTAKSLSVGAAAITNNAWNLMVVECDRSGNAVLYINGITVDTEDISSIPGSWDEPTEALKICRNNTFKGRIGYLAFDAYIYGATYCLEEYYRIKYGWPRKNNINADIGMLPQAVFNFNETLKDESETYELVYMPSGFPTYYGAGYPSSSSVEFNYRVGSEMGFLPLDGTVRTQGGELRLHPGPNKLFSTLVIGTNSTEKMIAFQGAWLSRSYIDLWEDSTKPQTLRGRIVTPPRIRPMRGGWYELTMEIEEQ